ncbi:MAG: hypothetical protein HC880_11205 [Bacteroidia bacterium]|nr:hypothetical protein [Bacteroidia bacterium]
MQSAFQDITSRNIRRLIIDVSQNGGGNEGNENLLFSYLADNYQKYKTVRAKAQKVLLDNGTDKPVKIKTFGFWERHFANESFRMAATNEK